MVAVLAAGLSRRYGADKLEQPLAGDPLGLHIGKTIAGLPFSRRFAVCSADRGVVPEGLRRLGIDVLLNPSPENGQSSSVAIASRTARSADSRGLVVCLADMPFVGIGLLTGLITSWSEDPSRPIVTVAGNYRGPPVIFPRSMFETLEALTGDRGGRDLLIEARTFTGDSSQLIDIDRPIDLEHARI